MTEALIEVSLLLFAALLGTVIWILLPEHWQGILIIVTAVLAATLLVAILVGG
jgi:hypothetical protein